MTEHARIVIIGGGVIGCSIAYHLARQGVSDVLVLEKAQLTHGSTWHAAGLVGQLRSKRNLTRLMQNSVAVFDRLAEESGQPIDWRKVGSLRLASSSARLAEIKRMLSQARLFGVEAELLSAAEAASRFPLIDPAGVQGAAWIPGDGYVDPYALTQAYAKVARVGGVRFREGVQVTGFERQGRRVAAVLTDHGRISCDTVVNAAGIWARRIAGLTGVALAAGAVEHQYMVTARTLDLPDDLPTLRDPDRLFYVKPDVNALVIGGWESNTRPLWRDGVPLDFARELLPLAIERFEPIALGATGRLPVLETLGVRDLVNGPIPVSADGEPIMGPAPGLDNFLLACGFTAGIAASGGAGEAMAHWIIDGDPGLDLWALDARRFGPLQAQGQFLEARMVESYGRYYALHWPQDELKSARSVRQSPLFGLLQMRGAIYGSEVGWERPTWFGDPQHASQSFTSPPGWFDAVGVEHMAVRQGVGLADLTSQTMLEVAGSDALAALQHMATNDLDLPDGRMVRTSLCNAAGGIEAHVTVLRLASDLFHVTGSTGTGLRDAGWIGAHLPSGQRVRLRDATLERAVIGLMGPRAREILMRVTEDDVSDAALPCLAARMLEIGMSSVLVVRTDAAGELGYEIHVPVDQAVHVYKALRGSTDCNGIADVGCRALQSLRLEAGRPRWGAELGPEVNPLEAGLGDEVSFGKGEFLGRAALARMAAEGPRRRLFAFAADGWVPLHGGEAILHQGRMVGTTTSAGFGYAQGRTLALGYLPVELSEECDFEIEAFLERHPARRVRHEGDGRGAMRLAS